MTNEDSGGAALSLVEAARQATSALTDYDYSVYFQAYVRAVCGEDASSLFGNYVNQDAVPAALITLGAFDGATHREPRSRLEVEAERDRLLAAPIKP